MRTVVELAFVVMPVGRLDDDLATDNPVVEVFEFGGLLADPCLDCGRRIHALKVDLQRYLHRVFDFVPEGLTS